jgi:ABC-type antimicrobial peptide transport system permease subunit
MQRKVVGAVISGVIGAGFGILFSWIASLIWPTPWTLGQAFIAVGIACFVASLSAWLSAAASSK